MTIRADHIKTLLAKGFVVAPGLPERRDAVEHGVRPARDIASRLMALDALFSWVSAPEEAVGSERLKSYVRRSKLEDRMTEEELEIWQLPREEALAEHGDAVGWRLENMWPLAWALGFPEKPDVDDGMISDQVIHGIFYEFLPGLGKTVDDLLAKSTPRADAELFAAEDYFYCAQNAVRSAQLGRPTVPKAFDPVTDGGVVHERRHAFTWCISPGVPWVDVDLST
jgi:hypothetical protein